MKDPLADWWKAKDGLCWLTSEELSYEDYQQDRGKGQQRPVRVACCLPITKVGE